MFWEKKHRLRKCFSGEHMDKKIIAYFSATGTTKKAAEALAKVTNADLYEIRPIVPYTAADLDWTNKTSRSSIEMANKADRPEIENGDIKIKDYEEIFLGFPIWKHIAPTVVNTFLEKYDFTNKKIILFATSGGGGLGNTLSELQISAPQAIFSEGKVLNDQSTQEFEAWINSYAH